MNSSRKSCCARRTGCSTSPSATTIGPAYRTVTRRGITESTRSRSVVIRLPAFYWDKQYPGNYIAATKDPDYVPWGPATIDPNTLRAGYTHNWNAGVQCEVAKDTKVEVNYVGNIGQRLHGGNLKGNNPDMTAYSNWVKNHGMWNSVYDEASAKAEG